MGGASIEGGSSYKCPLSHVVSLTRLVAFHAVVLLSLLFVFVRGGSAIQVVRSLTLSGAGSTCPFGRMLNNLGVLQTDNSNSRCGRRVSEGRRFRSQSGTKRKITRGGKVMKRGDLLNIPYGVDFSRHNPYRNRNMNLRPKLLP